MKDANDILRERGPAALVAMVDNAKPAAEIAPPKTWIEFLSPSQLRDFHPPEGWNLVGDYHLQRETVVVIGGAPGIGKSRALVSLANAGAQGAGAEWFGLPVHRQFRTMIVQAENGRVRLQRDFDRIDTGRLDEFLRVCPPPPYGIRFDQREFVDQLKAGISEFQPDVIAFDPWNAVAAEDKQKDYLAAFESIRSALPTGDDRPAMVIVAHTRKPSSQERASGAGLLATLAGSYVLGSVPRAAFVMQRATNETTDDRVVWTCCKNNDGEMGARSAWRRGNGLFVPAGDFDWQAFDNPEGKGKREIDEDLMEAAFNGEGITRKELVDRLKSRDFGKSAAYEAIKRFEDHIDDTGGILKWT